MIRVQTYLKYLNFFQIGFNSFILLVYSQPTLQFLSPLSAHSQPTHSTWNNSQPTVSTFSTTILFISTEVLPLFQLVWRNAPKATCPYTEKPLAQLQPNQQTAALSRLSRSCCSRFELQRLKTARAEWPRVALLH